MNGRQTLRLLSVSLLALAVGACRGTAPVDVMGSGPGTDDDWQCRPAPDGGWACTRESVAAEAADGVEAPVVVAPPAAAPVPAAPAAPREAPRAEPGEARAAAPPPPARAVPQQRQRPAAPALAETALLANVPATHYAVQLIALQSEAALDGFVAERQLGAMTRVRVESGGRLHFALVAGVYPSRGQADQAVAALPPALRALKPWVRTVGSLQAAMARADALAQAR